MIGIWTLPNDKAERQILHKRCQHYLSAEERQRAELLKSPQIAERFLLGRILTRTVLADHLGCAPQRVPLQQTASGKLILKTPINLVFNLSHSRLSSVLAVGRGRALGIDMEHNRNRARALKIAHHYFSDAEKSWLKTKPDDALQLWLIKESVVKALGLSVWDSLKGVQLMRVKGKIQIQKLPKSMPIKNWHIRTDIINNELSFSVAFQSESRVPFIRIKKYSARPY